MTHQTHRFAMLFAAALAGALLAAPAAQAFTFERNASGDSGPGVNYTDPEQNLTSQQDNGTGQGQKSTFQSGGLSVHMNRFNGTSSFDQRYNGNNLLDPFAREGR